MTYLTKMNYFDTVHLIVWRNTPLINPTFPAFLAQNNASIANLYRLPFTLFTTLCTSKFLTPVGPFLTFGTNLVILVFSLLSLLLAYTLFRTNKSDLRYEHARLVEDILNHEQFLKLKNYRHHHDDIYDHVARVSYMSYRITRALGLDYMSAARGGLLHDFFLYDWRERKATDAHHSSHGKEHPYIALENSKKYFNVNEKEADIIVKHMFPKTLALPRYSESYIVSLSDKISAIYEYTLRFKRA